VGISRLGIIIKSAKDKQIAHAFDIIIWNLATTPDNNPDFKLTILSVTNLEFPVD
jgi:hypothetical protein